MNIYKFLTLDTGYPISRKDLYKVLHENSHSTESAIDWVNSNMIVAFGYCYLSTDYDWANDLYRQLLNDEYKFHNNYVHSLYWKK
jgi:hypothetical protein